MPLCPIKVYINEEAQYCGISSDVAMEILQSPTKPLICGYHLETLFRFLKLQHLTFHSATIPHEHDDILPWKCFPDLRFAQRSKNAELWFLSLLLVSTTCWTVRSSCRWLDMPWGSYNVIVMRYCLVCHFEKWCLISKYIHGISNSYGICNQTSKISYTQSQNIDVSLLVLQLSLLNLLKPGVKSRIKM